MLTGENEGSSCAEEAEERSSFIAAERRHFLSFTEREREIREDRRLRSVRLLQRNREGEGEIDHTFYIDGSVRKFRASSQGTLKLDKWVFPLLGYKN